MIHRIVRALSAIALALFWLVPSVSAAAGPTIAIVSPTAGQKVTSTDIPVEVSWANFTVDCLQAGMPDKPGVGHIHPMLDGMSMAVLTNFQCATKFTISGQGVKPGMHKLIVDLASNTHMDMEDTVKDVTFDYEPTTPPPALPAPANVGLPSVALQGIADGQTVGPKFSFTVVPTNFTPSADLEGKQNVKGFGHYHVFVDMPMMMSSGGMMSMAGMIAMPGSNTISVDLSAWPSGKHSFVVEPVQDDHTPIEGAKEAMISITLNNPAVPAKAAATTPATMPKTGGDPYALPAAVLGSLALIGIGAGLRQRRRPGRNG